MRMKKRQQSKSWNPTDCRKWLLYALHGVFSVGHHHHYAPLFHSYAKKAAIVVNTVSSSLHIFTNFPVYMLLPITFPAPSGWSFSCPHGLTGILHIRIMYVHEKQKIPPLLSQEQLQCYYSEAQNTFIHLRANHITQTYFCTQTSLTVLIEPWLEIAGTRERRNCIQMSCNQDCHPIKQVVKTTAAHKKFLAKE